MNNKLRWEEIQKVYSQEWVQLVDYDWPDDEPYPFSGVVRTHAAGKKEFYKLCKEGMHPDDSAILFVGPKKRTEGMFFSPNLVRFFPCGR